MTSTVFQMLSIVLHSEVKNLGRQSVTSVSTHRQHSSCNSRPGYLSSQSFSLCHLTVSLDSKASPKDHHFCPQEYIMKTVISVT